MALKFCDSFDGAPPGSKWTSVANLSGPSTTYGRFSSKGVQVYGSGVSAVYRLVPSNAGFGFLGAAVAVTGLSSSNYGVFGVGATTSLAEQCRVVITAAGAVQLVANGAQVAISANGIFVPNAMRFIELKVKVDNTIGELTVRVDGVQVVTFTGNTRAATNSGNEFGLVGISPLNSAQAVYFDDFYYFDDTGAQNNTFAGDCRIYNLVPNGNGYLNQWTRTGGGAGGNYTAVSEVTPDDDTSFNADGTLNDIDSYACSDPGTVPGGIKGLYLFSRFRKDDVTARSVAPFIRMGATNGFGATTVCPSTYMNQLDVFELSPATGIAPTVAEVNALEIGMQVKV